MISHVPFKPESDDAFALTSEEAWGGRRLYWGKDGEYYPDANTRDVMDYLYSDESPVKAVLCGHLHFAYEGPLTSDQSGTMQYVTAPAFLHYITVFTVTGSSGHSN